MIRPLAAFLRALDAARTAGTLARTVRLLARQLDNAHLLAASEGSRADRAELRVAELERALQDWREASGELAREQPADDALPSVLDAGEAPIPLVLTDSAREADIQRDRADALFASLRACEVELQQTRAQLRQTEAAAGAHLATIERLRSEAETCKWQHRTCSDCGAMQSFIGQGLYECWKCTATALREQIAAAHRATHAIAPADPPCQCGHPASVHGREGCGAPGEDTHACPCERFQVYGHHPRPAEQIPGVAAARMLSRLECAICPYVARELDEEAGDKCPACGSKLAEVESCDACGKPARDGERTGEAEAVLLCGRCRAKAEAEEAARTSATLTLAAHGNDPQRGTAATAAYRAAIEAARAAATEIEPPPPTRPSERTTDNKEPRP